MKFYLQFFLFLFSTSTFTYSQTQVTIGNQVWMQENLNVNKFRNGETIPEAKSAQDWTKADSLKTPVWCYVDFDVNKEKAYGKLYNWYAVSDPRGLAPTGWHVPSKDEWIIMIDHSNKNHVRADTSSEDPETRGFSCNGCKSIDSLYYTPAGYSHAFKSKLGWVVDEDDEKRSPSVVGRDSTGFSGLPGGYYDGGIKHMNNEFYGYFWSSSEVVKNSSYAWGYILDADYLMCIGSVEWELSKISSEFISENGDLDKVKYNELYNSLITGAGSPKSSGFSVRCIKD